MRRMRVVVLSAMLSVASWTAVPSTGIPVSDPGAASARLRGNGPPSEIRCGLCMAGVISVLVTSPVGPLLSLFDHGGYGFGLCVRWCSAR